ncbi:MAG: hypothetical protein HY866_07080 [Chloroflexi bacterium]|nr:hypothetical protein [Chloroflexota bacterium]
MSDNPPPGSADVNRVQEYQRLVLAYEALDEEIDGLLELHQGGTDHMSASDLDHYRELARRRDEIHNQIRELEQQIALDDENS